MCEMGAISWSIVVLLSASAGHLSPGIAPVVSAISSS